jgi:hypothetical protein
MPPGAPAPRTQPSLGTENLFADRIAVMHLKACGAPAPRVAVSWTRRPELGG